MATKVDSLYKAVCDLNQREKRELLRRLAALPEFAEDLYDLTTYFERKGLPSHAYEELRAEFQAEGRV